ncbi:hypothetical protein Adeg_0733 [Ammonifex degensii KC4]|uniref:Uncharacterized protein n=1 Tax=Ammonifex degensii (strain DSM 10501 / KC4) TaxID=429009 RepID=C9RCA2_AMMDK|nr:hypothetical protein Adeg_0733 [Ammonifex degensii KC4]
MISLEARRRRTLFALLLLCFLAAVLSFFPPAAFPETPGYEGSDVDEFLSHAHETHLPGAAASWQEAPERQQALKEKSQDNQPTEDEGGLFERAIAEVFNAIFKVLWGLLDNWGFKDPDKLIFAKPERWDDLLHPAPFTPDTWRKLDAMYYGMVGVSWALYMVLVLVASGRFVLGGLSKSPEARAEGKATLWRMLFALVVMAGAPVLVRAFFVLANAVQVGIVDAAGSSSGILDREFVQNLKTGSVLGTAIVKCAFAWVTFHINLIFWVRDVVMYVMYVFTPLMAVLWATNRNVTAAAVWLGELLSNAFLPAAYALAGAVVVVFTSVGDVGWPQKLVGVIMLVTLAKVLRNGLQGLWTRWAGVEEEGAAAKIAAGITGAIGVAGVLGLGRAFSASLAPPKIQFPAGGVTGGGLGGVAGSGAVGAGGGLAGGGAGPWGVAGSVAPSLGGAPGGLSAAGAGTPGGFSVAGVGLSGRSLPGESSPTAHHLLGGTVPPGEGVPHAADLSRGENWHRTPTGLLAPNPVLPGGTVGASSTPSSSPSSPPPLTPEAEARMHALQAINRFHRVGHFAGRVSAGTVGALNAPGAAAVPEGMTFLRQVAGATAWLTEKAGYAAGLAYGTYRALKGREGSAWEKLKQAPRTALDLNREYRQLTRVRSFDGYRFH